MRNRTTLVLLALLAAACEPSHDGFWEDEGHPPDARGDGSCAASLTLRASMQPSDGFLSFGDASGFAAVRPDGDTLSAWLFSAAGTDGGWYENATLPAGSGPIAEAEIRPAGGGEFVALARTAGLPTGIDAATCNDAVETICEATDFGRALAPVDGSGDGSGSGEGSGTSAQPDCTEALATENQRILDGCIADGEARCLESGLVSPAEVAAAGSCLDAVNALPDGPTKDGLYTDLAAAYTDCIEVMFAAIRDASDAVELGRQRCEEAAGLTSGTIALARLARGTLRTAFTDTGLLPAPGLSLVHDVEFARNGAGLLVALVGAPTTDLAAVEVRTALLDPATGLIAAPAAAIDTTGCTLDREARDLTLTGEGDHWFLLGSSLAPTGLCLIPLDARGQRTTNPVRLIAGAGVDYAATFADGQLWVARGTPMPATPVELSRYDASGAAVASELLSAPFDCPLTSLKESALQVTGDALRVAYTAVCSDGSKQFFMVGRTAAAAPLSAWIATVDSTRNALFPGGSPDRFNYLYDATTDTYRVRTGSCEGR